MGAVYLVERDDGRRFAVKLMYREMADRHPEFVIRFRREAEFAMKISHRNLIAVYEAGLDGVTGCNYMVMDYVSGGTLHDRLKREGAFNLPDDAKFIVRNIAAALGAAHALHVVHRDLKPENIMFGADGVPKLADLGIAKFSDADDGEDAPTLRNQMIGTPAYMSPEQMQDSHAVDIRADIFSLGVMFWEMLAGKRPTQGKSSVEIMSSRIKGEKIPDIRTVRPDVSAPIAELIAYMTEPKRENRPASPSALLKLIEKVDRGESPLPHPGHKSIKVVHRKGDSVSSAQVSNGSSLGVGSLIAIVGGIILTAIVCIIALLPTKDKLVVKRPVPEPMVATVSPLEPEADETPVPEKPEVKVETPPPPPAATAEAVKSEPVPAHPKPNSPDEPVKIATAVDKPPVSIAPETSAPATEQKPEDDVRSAKADVVEYSEPVLVSDVERGVRDVEMSILDDVGIEFVGCPAGTFKMGKNGSDAADDWHRLHEVTISRNFWIGRFKVTGRQWKAIFPDKNPFQVPSPGPEDDENCIIRNNGYEHQLADPDWPCNRASIRDIEVFCEKLTALFRRQFADVGIPEDFVVRLPTEAEWEYAFKANSASSSDPYSCDSIRGDVIKKVYYAEPIPGVNPKRMVFFGGYPPVKEMPGQEFARWPNAWGIYGFFNQREITMDTVDAEKTMASYKFVAGQTALVYEDRETDPLRTFAGGHYIVRKPEPSNLFFKIHSAGWAMGDVGFRLAIAPDLIGEKVKAIRDAAAGKRFVTSLGNKPPVNSNPKRHRVSLGSASMSLVLCPAGAFRVGDPAVTDASDRNRYREVHIRKPFWTSKFKVTRELWKAVMHRVQEDSVYKRDCSRFVPVNGVSQREISDFCEQIMQKARNSLPRGMDYADYVLRLPTIEELEWIRVAGATDPADVYTQDSPEPIKDVFPTVREFRNFVVDYDECCGMANTGMVRNLSYVLKPGFRPLPEEKLRKRLNAWGIAGLVGNGREATISADEKPTGLTMVGNGMPNEETSRITRDGGFRLVYAPPVDMALETADVSGDEDGEGETEKE